ncbi:hypothetical protein BJ684DRAFT_16601 [Piptocephalis cylindrospora]|uniref:Uncharacterized protein n=1 Tax=Piptocephalis cylindrospora TaxID=1907219 RepID=A0A4P9Y596_9FUNG|nr:hypothetical protein BJ684DRAFT_16601 [Piptocephalis cylindrospora]|eukprot:RKP12960.1 hypothetical protein BJ684DRAFT_16601 [Piptocephalis cylindrospora]
MKGNGERTRWGKEKRKRLDRRKKRWSEEKVGVTEWDIYRGRVLQGGGEGGGNDDHDHVRPLPLEPRGRDLAEQRRWGSVPMKAGSHKPGHTLGLRFSEISYNIVVSIQLLDAEDETRWQDETVSEDHMTLKRRISSSSAKSYRGWTCYNTGCIDGEMYGWVPSERKEIKKRGGGVEDKIDRQAGWWIKATDLGSWILDDDGARKIRLSLHIEG